MGSCAQAYQSGQINNHRPHVQRVRVGVGVRGGGRSAYARLCSGGGNVPCPRGVSWLCPDRLSNSACRDATAAHLRLAAPPRYSRERFRSRPRIALARVVRPHAWFESSGLGGGRARVVSCRGETTVRSGKRTRLSVRPTWSVSQPAHEVTENAAPPTPTRASEKPQMFHTGAGCDPRFRRVNGMRIFIIDLGVGVGVVVGERGERRATYAE